ncbi:hypothetical protein C5167_048435 [Papaver somniferum]|uniref:CASP-like protein n=1 Tax=Papaver somniferum TaxID=3469 RepID=A0A4Y7KKV2_PAPSO|nr:CASP-like protein 4A4 [Papaver somniferum]RZC72950.1 hypothetical protein C5167_048435 [Papaver somniferum]
MKMAGESQRIIFYPSQEPLPTPSPFTFSVAGSTTLSLSSQPAFRYANLFLRFGGFLFSFISAICLVFPSPQYRNYEPSTFLNTAELTYCFIVSILASIYSAYQLFKGVCDIAYRARFISDKMSDYSSFILDQLVAYLLISSSSILVLTIHRIIPTTSVWKSAVVSASMSCITFVIIAISTLQSGYKLCKRLIW